MYKILCNCLEKASNYYRNSFDMFINLTHKFSAIIIEEKKFC